MDEALTLDQHHGVTAEQTPQAGTRGLVAVFAVTSFVSAALLFSVQPLFAKMVLPVLGGAPSVWAVAICFFQVALLVGYAYAHLLKSRLSIAMSGWVQIALVVFTLCQLPIGIPASWHEPPPGDPTLWQLGLFVAGVGLPFVVISANAPLLQAWFAATRHPAARDPYFLYSASNLGSFVALLGYPFVLEPAFGLKALGRYWSIGFILLALLIAYAFALMLRNAASNPAIPPPRNILADAAGQPAWRRRAHWVLLAMIPSALLTAITTHIATDIASAPLIWVIPLALYLLTFVLAFREHSLVPRTILLPAQAIAVVVALLVLSQTRSSVWYLTAPVGLNAFVLSAWVAHRTLYEERPPARYLTEFYLLISLGGALGGLAAALLAPKLFSEVLEYPLLLALTFACRPGALSLGPKPFETALALFCITVLAGLGIYWTPLLLDWMPAGRIYVELYEWGASALAAAVMAVALVASFRSPPRMLAAALGMCAAVSLLPSMVKKGAAQRSYFGVYRVEQSADGQWNTLVHGSTLHGAQRIRDENGNSVADISPATYYYEGSPMARTVATRRAALARLGVKGRYGVVGLGTGSMACNAAEGEYWRFFEIDPVVVGIAGGTKNFTYLENCLPDTDIRLGDARLTLAKEADASFDLIVVDAFSSDAIPVHLMTAEALKLYLSKVKPGGVVLLHISNRYLDLDAVLGATAAIVPEAHGFLLSDDVADGSYAQSNSTVALFAHADADLDAYRDIAELEPLAPGKMRAWTDDYSDILYPVISKYRRRYGE